MSLLAVKRRRDVRRQRWQFAAVAVTIGLGVMLFATSYDAYLNLETSYRETYDRLAFADMTVVGVDGDFVETVEAIDGVEVGVHRHQADLPFRVGDDVLQGRVVGIPVDQQPPVDRIDVQEGDYLPATATDGSQVVVETHMAQDLGVGLGDTIEIGSGDQLLRTEVVGIAVSAEYIWPARSRQDILPPPGTFGVVFGAEQAVAALPESVAVSQVLVLYESGADRGVTDAAVRQAADRAGAADVVPQAEQASNETLQLDVDGFQELAVLFPALFLLAAGLAAFVLLNRVVYQQRAQIGTLRASGMSRRTLRRHYLSYGVRTGLGGAVVGTVVGMVLAWLATGLYTDSLGIPDTARGFHPVTPVVGVAFGLVTGALAALAPATGAFRLSPAEAMRGETPPRAGTRSLAERVLPPLRRLKVRWLMVLRSIGRARRRSASTVLGVVLALVLVMVSWGMIDSMVALVDRQFDDIDLEDASVVLSVPLTSETVAEVAAVDGVAVAEPVTVLSAALASDADRYSTELQVYESGTRVHGFGGDPPTTGLVAGAAVAAELDVEAGDTVTVALPTIDTTVDVAVQGFVDEPFGTYAYLDTETFDSLVDGAGGDAASVRSDPNATSVQIVVADEADRETVLDAVDALPDVASVIDERALADLVDDYLAFFYVFVGIMLVFGGVMAFALIFNTISVNVAERSGEIATMRANGLSHGRIARLVAAENLLLTSLGIAPGLVAGWLVGAWFLQQFSSDLFTLDFSMRPASIVICAVALLAVAGLSLIPAVRTIGRLDIGSVVRERSR